MISIMTLMTQRSLAQGSGAKDRARADRRLNRVTSPPRLKPLADADTGGMFRPQWFPAFLVVLMAGIAPAVSAAGIDDRTTRVVPAAEAAPVWSVGSTLYYSVGNYGKARETQFWELSPYLQYRQGATRIRVTTPYLSVTTTRQVLSRRDSLGHRSTIEQSTTHSGPGDVTLSGDYTFPAVGYGFNLIPYANIKLGTASIRLGTGETDYELGLGVTRAIGTSFFPFAHAGYRWVGKSDLYTLNSYPTYDAGASYRLGRGNYLTAMLYGHPASQPSSAAVAEASVAWNYSPKPQYGLQVYVVKGLSNGSPDFGVGIGGNFRF